MSGFRLPAPVGTHIDRAVPLGFTFNGRRFAGFRGDTLASALLASGVRMMARSYKFHRPRGIYTCGIEEPAGFLDVGTGPRTTPNSRAPGIDLADGLQAHSANCWPSLSFDVAAVTDKLSGLLPTGFYYKTFIWPSWRLFEPLIRRMAGPSLPALDPDPDRYDVLHSETDILVIGGGVTGTAAALAAAESGAQVTLASLGSPLQKPSLARAGVNVLSHTTACGIYDHLMVMAVETPSDISSVRQRLHKIRARSVVLATGAFERPMMFPDNDRPGIMLAKAVVRYAERFGVACGKRAVLVANGDYAYSLAATLVRYGISVGAVVDRRPTVAPNVLAELPDSVEVLQGAAIVGVRGVKSVTDITVAAEGGVRRDFSADLICSAGGVIPNVALWAQAGGALRWIEDSSMFVPDRAVPAIAVVGACAGIFDHTHALEHAAAVGEALAKADALPALPAGAAATLGTMLADTSPPAEWLSRRPAKIFVDLRNDVTTADVELAARENYRSVEHFKRYTTAGMGTDQGKTANVNALVRLGSVTHRKPNEVGTTRFRPPFTPVTLNTLAAGRRGPRLHPVKRLPAHAWHVAQGAVLEDFGSWLRPVCYPRGGESVEQAAARESVAVRTAVGIFDASPLGKLEVHGPDAAAFLDWMYLGNVSGLEVGQARWDVLLQESGVIFDDGVVARISENSFWVNTSSGNAERVAQRFEEWLQRELSTLRVSVTPVTWHWANLTAAGPKAWDMLSAAGLPPDLAPNLMPHMSIRLTEWQGTPLRIVRASFSGELSYEVNFPASKAEMMCRRFIEAGRSFDAQPYGVEALQILRVEKGLIHVGGDTDGETYPADIGIGRAVARKPSDFVGRRSLSRPAALDPGRRQLIGLVPRDGKTPLPAGAHITDDPPPSRSQGFVTSSCFSTTLGHPIALARLVRGRERVGERVKLFNMGRFIDAQVVSLPFLDPQGARLRGY